MSPNKSTCYMYETHMKESMNSRMSRPEAHSFCFREKLQRKCAKRRSESVSVQGNPRHFCKSGVQQATRSMNSLSFRRSESHTSRVWEKKLKEVRNNPDVLMPPFFKWLPLQLQHYDTRWSLIYYHEPTVILAWHFGAPQVENTR